VSGPTPPRGVRVKLVNGDVVPCELVYKGQDHRGYHIWEAGIIDEGSPPSQILMDLLPARTSVLVNVIEPGGQ